MDLLRERAQDFSSKATTQNFLSKNNIFFFLSANDKIIFGVRELVATQILQIEVHTAFIILVFF